MGAIEVRNKDALIEIRVDGQRLGGSFSAVKGFNLKPDLEMPKKQFTGDKRWKMDLNVKGYDFSFKTEKRDHVWFALWKKIELAEFNGLPLPDITLSVTIKYRDGTGRANTYIVHGDLVLAMKGDDIPAEYQEISWEGGASFAS